MGRGPRLRKTRKKGGEGGSAGRQVTPIRLWEGKNQNQVLDRERREIASQWVAVAQNFCAKKGGGTKGKVKKTTPSHPNQETTMGRGRRKKGFKLRERRDGRGGAHEHGRKVTGGGPRNAKGLECSGGQLTKEVGLEK